MGLIANQNVQKCMAFESSGFRMINSFTDEYMFLSNFFPSEITLQGIKYPTAEHAFQASKALHEAEKIWVAESPTPGIAKRRGRKVTLIPDWENAKLRYMYVIIGLKFSDPNLMRRLAETEPHKLIEGNYWHDNFWGDCFCDKCVEPGRNYLGKFLMDKRKNL